jgi:hypothetical protein
MGLESSKLLPGLKLIFLDKNKEEGYTGNYIFAYSTIQARFGHKKRGKMIRMVMDSLMLLLCK